MVDTTSDAVTILLVDSSDLARAGLRAVLADDPRFTVVGDAAGDAIAAARRLQPDLVVLDPAGDGDIDLEYVADLGAASPGSKIVIFSDAFEPGPFLQVMHLGVHAYLLKGPATADFVRETLAYVGRFAAVVTDRNVVARFRARVPSGLRFIR